MQTVFWIFIFLLFWIYLGYPFTLFILMKIKRKEKGIIRGEYYSKISIIIAAYNEGKKIKERIRNCLTLDYPAEKIEVIVASDGSTDKTVETAKKFERRRVVVLDFKARRGKATAHNDAIKEARGDIIVFTDADTRFEKNFLKEMVINFKNPKIGCVVGNLIYRSRNSSISKSEGLYWKFETKLREMESNLGILATATGACMAVKKRLWKNLTPIDDSDFTTPLDVILQNYRVVFAKDAIAYDVPSFSIKEEIRTRIRGTSKNFIGTLKRWGAKNWIKCPIVSWGLLSHKILRWLAPFFMLGIFITNIFLVNHSLFYKFIFAGQIIFYVMSILGLVSEIFKKRPPIISTIFSFCIANISMGIGVIKGLFGKAPVKFKN